MNQDQPLWVRISQAGEVKDQVKVTDWRQALRAIHESFDSHNGRKVQMVVEVSNQPLKESLLTHDQQVEQQIAENALEDPNTIVYPPDVTLRECQEAWTSDVGQLMFTYQRPENRMGIEPERLMAIAMEYKRRFPRVAPHGPKWTTT